MDFHMVTENSLQHLTGKLFAYKLGSTDFTNSFDLSFNNNIYLSMFQHGWYYIFIKHIYLCFMHLPVFHDYSFITTDTI